MRESKRVKMRGQCKTYHDYKPGYVRKNPPFLDSLPIKTAMVGDFRDATAVTFQLIFSPARA